MVKPLKVNHTKQSLAPCLRCRLGVRTSQLAGLCRKCLLRPAEPVGRYTDGFTEYDAPPRGWLEHGLNLATRLPRLRWDACPKCEAPGEDTKTPQCVECLARFLSHPVRARMNRRMATIERLATGADPAKVRRAVGRLAHWTAWQEKRHAGIASPLPVEIGPLRAD